MRTYTSKPKQMDSTFYAIFVLVPVAQVSKKVGSDIGY